MKTNPLSVLLIPATACVACLFAVSPLYALTVSVAPNGNIQSAIDQVAAAGGGTVNVTAGAATRTTSLRLKSKVTVNGAGAPATTLNAGGNFTVFVQNAEGINTVTLQNIKLVGRGTGGPRGCQGFFMSSTGAHFNNIKGSNIELQNFAGIACHYKRADNSIISNCNFHDNGGSLLDHNLYIRECASTNVSGSNLSHSAIGSGFHLAGVTTGGSIKTSTLNANGQDGMNLQDAPSKYTVDGCTTNGNRDATAGRPDGVGINAQHGGGTIKNCTSTGNHGANYKIGKGWATSNNH